MARVKRGVAAHNRRKLTLRHTKGFRWGRKSKYRLAKEALLKAWKYSFRDRKTKKRAFRRIWETQINAALQLAQNKPLSYSKFMHALKTYNVALDRKILALLAKEKPLAFKAVVEAVTQ